MTTIHRFSFRLRRFVYNMGLDSIKNNKRVVVSILEGGTSMLFGDTTMMSEKNPSWHVPFHDRFMLKAQSRISRQEKKNETLRHSLFAVRKCADFLFLLGRAVCSVYNRCCYCP